MNVLTNEMTKKKHVYANVRVAAYINVFVKEKQCNCILATWFFVGNDGGGYTSSVGSFAIKKKAIYIRRDCFFSCVCTCHVCFGVLYSLIKGAYLGY